MRPGQFDPRSLTRVITLKMAFGTGQAELDKI
jgi:hypothetical protein